MEEGTGAIAGVVTMSHCVQLRLRGCFLSLPLAGSGWGHQGRFSGVFPVQTLLCVMEVALFPSHAHR